ncbi:DUF427 domain-containing protein [Rathayibacter soli]|uniref:DUF427 domain-containing protein n=1 Tax=Rathayibacter soli TaxID=3144168 RepID=UPI0027E46DF0|nr:DUF427 domain-containing protein [Glaciibacter superstes]
MYRAIWHGAVLAESDQTVEVEGNQYFPPTSVNQEYFQNSELSSVCPWKGTASYYTVTVDGKTNRDAAWYYPHPSPAAAGIRDHVAFWKGVQVVTAHDGDPTTEPERDGFFSRLMKHTH